MNLSSFLEALISGGKLALATSFFGGIGLLVYAIAVNEKIVYLPYALAVLAVISVFAGGINGGLAAAAGGWIHGGLVGIIYLLIVALIKVFVFQVWWFEPGFLLFAFCLLAAGSLGGIAGINLKYRQCSRMRINTRRKYGH